MAIEALWLSREHIKLHQGTNNVVDATDKALNACKEALEQPAQKPDGCGNCHACLVNVKTEQGWPATATRMIVCPECGNKRCPKASNHRYDCTHSNDIGQLGSIYPNFTPQPAQEPYRCHWVEKGKGHCERNNRMGLPDVYTHPHQWQGLTDDEIEAIDDVTLGDYYSKKDAMDFARAIEQALRIKNGS